MARKSIGQFIAALRKANGMTQKQLGEMLGVSDKAVSRWERDECAPDLSLIPVIAEIFSVTSDEILCGERIAHDNLSYEPKETVKTEKQIERILKSSETKFKIRSIISVGIAGVGILGALIANFGFNRAYIGFFVGCIFILAALVCESIFTYLSFSAVNSNDIETENINDFKLKLFGSSCRCFSLIIILFAFLLPLIAIPDDTFEGLWVSTMFFYGAICMAAAAILCVFATWISRLIAVKEGLLSLNEASKIKDRLRVKYLVIGIVLIAATFIVQICFNGFCQYTAFVKGEVFTDIDEFKKYMETPMPSTNPSFQEKIRDRIYETISAYYAENGELENEDEFNEDTFYETETIEDNYGKVVCEFVHRNMNVSSYNYEFDDNGKLTYITTYTQEDWERGSTILNFINYAFIAAYIIECLCVVIVYNKKKRNIAL